MQHATGAALATGAQSYNEFATCAAFDDDMLTFYDDFATGAAFYDDRCNVLQFVCDRCTVVR